MNPDGRLTRNNRDDTDARKYFEAVQAAFDTEKARAEKAEQERDEWKDSAIKAMADLERAEHPHSLTPDASKVTSVVVIGPGGSEFETWGLYANGAHIEVQDDGRTLKVFPARHPEADSIQELIEEYTGPGGPDFADFLAERGVRVVTEEQP